MSPRANAKIPEAPSVPNYIKKLSTVKIVGKISGRDVEIGKSLDLYEVVGIASGSKTGSTDYGEWIALTGQFAAVNLKTGEEFMSGVAFLPEVGLDPVLGQLGVDGVNAVEFGWVVGIKGDADVQCGYVYYVRPIVTPDANDPLELLKGAMSKPALAALKAEK